MIILLIDNGVSYRPIPAVLRKTPHFSSYFMDDSTWSFDIDVPLIELPANFSHQEPILAVYHNGLRIGEASGDPLRALSDASIPTPQDFSVEASIMKSKAVVTLRIPRTRKSDKGIYEIVVFTSLVPGDFSCCTNYYRLLTDPEGLGMQYFVNGLAVLQLKFAGKSMLQICPFLI